MTTVDTIRIKAEALPVEQQLQVLDFVEFLEQRRAANSGKKPSVESVRQALAAAAGIWADRTDLPEDSAEAAQVVRDRARQSSTRQS